MHLLDPVRAALRDSRLSRYRLVTISKGPDTEPISGTRATSGAISSPATSRCYRSPPPGAPPRNSARVVLRGLVRLEAEHAQVTMLKSLGLPIVAYPMEFHVATLRHRESCLFAETVEEWADCVRLPLGSRRP